MRAVACFEMFPLSSTGGLDEAAFEPGCRALKYDTERVMRRRRRCCCCSCYLKYPGGAGKNSLRFRRFRRRRQQLDSVSPCPDIIGDGQFAHDT